MKKAAVVLMISLLSGGASLAFAGKNGGLADRYNEDRSYPNKSDESHPSQNVTDIREAIKELEEEHKAIKELIANQLKKTDS